MIFKLSFEINFVQIKIPTYRSFYSKAEEKQN